MSNNCEIKNMLVQQLVLLLIVLTKFSVKCVMFSVGPCLFNAFESCEANDIHYYLYSSDQPKIPFRVDNSNIEIPNRFNLSWPMKVILHGYAGSLDYNATADIRRAYMKLPNINVLAVDWGELATLPCYPAAAFNTVQVGHCTASMLLALSILDESFKPENAHLVGFSLGAHAAAYTANYLLKMTGALQKRITGLDPALPFFSTPQLSWKLDSTDAHYVDIIHTDAGYLGKAEALGHADFYVNGGSRQPVCKGQEYEHLCSHNAAPAYFAESITSKVGFYGSKCSSYIEHILRWCPADDKGTREIMGDPSKPGTIGVFYVQTNDKQPFAKG